MGVAKTFGKVEVGFMLIFVNNYFLPLNRTIREVWSVYKVQTCLELSLSCFKRVFRESFQRLPTYKVTREKET